MKPEVVEEVKKEEQKQDKLVGTLYKKEAFVRSEKIKDVRYRIVYAMLPGGKNFMGQVEVDFRPTEELSDEWAFLDY